MQYVLLISNPSHNLAKIYELVSRYMDANLNEKDGVLSIKAHGEYITIRRENDGLKDFDEDEVKTIKSSLKNPKVYTVHYKIIDDVKQVLKYIADLDDVFIDTDTGLLLTGKEFNKMCESRPGWDWLTD